MKDMCTNCEKRSNCRSLCPEAVRYVDQDQVSERLVHRDGAFPILLSESMLAALEERNPLARIWDQACSGEYTVAQLSRFAEKIKAYLRFKRGDSIRRIAADFGITRYTIYRWVYDLSELEERALSTYNQGQLNKLIRTSEPTDPWGQEVVEEIFHEAQGQHDGRKRPL